ncbi:hypothetical protein ARMSODRAFT_948032 [Armillaria solidipes]|uniref:BTB domain-containing protein n=1 Tax=Armillaria solidipes TaxID=1076256 RepID=A0A2H3CJF8_9AGAR|nr:hypothetical protein ARMSODRAFT_948032 [Armillaria solidipes]
MATKPTITIADAPFDDPTDSVDLVIRTADNVDFYVLSGLLSLKSPSSFFRHVLKSSQHTEEKDGYPVLEVKEDSDTFRTILLLCYPDVAPQIKSIDQIVAVKEALDKYCMDHAQEKFMQTVTASPPMKDQALRIFALALVNGWRVLGEAAAKSALTIPLDDPEADPEEELEDLCSINALQYIRLRNYHRKCRRVAQDMFLDPWKAPWLEGKVSELLFPHGNTITCRWCGKSLGSWCTLPSFRTHPWVTDYHTTVKAKMLRRPHPDTALDEAIIADAVTKSVSQCPEEEWKKIAISQVRLCGKFLMEEMDKQISQIPLNIDWTK